MLPSLHMYLLVCDMIQPSTLAENLLGRKGSSLGVNDLCMGKCTANQQGFAPMEPR